MSLVDSRLLRNCDDVIAAGGSAPIETRAYLGDYAIITRSASGQTVEYLLTDRLGSVDAVANASGAIIEKRGYDAFGAPRNGATWANLTPKRLQSLAVTQKGYTAHEHLNSVELIHMNGRAYDHRVGRFLSVDPLIQFPLNSQSLNPYSYVLNNPMGWTDPTGFSACGILACSILPRRGFWWDKIREKYAFSIRPNGGGATETMTGTGGRTVATVEVLGLSNGASGQSTLGAAREDNVKDGASELGAADSRKAAASSNGAYQNLQDENTRNRNSEVTLTGCGSKYGCATTTWGSDILSFSSPRPDTALDRAAADILSPLKMKSDGEWVGYIQFRGPVGYVASKPRFVKHELPDGNTPTVSYVVPLDAVAVYHTHPYFRGVSSQNVKQSNFGRRDAEIVYRRGIPNYLKGGGDSAVKVLEMTPMGPLSRSVEFYDDE